MYMQGDDSGSCCLYFKPWVYKRIPIVYAIMAIPLLKDILKLIHRMFIHNLKVILNNPLSSKVILNNPLSHKVILNRGEY